MKNQERGRKSMKMKELGKPKEKLRKTVRKPWFDTDTDNQGNVIKNDGKQAGEWYRLCSVSRSVCEPRGRDVHSG